LQERSTARAIAPHDLVSSLEPWQLASAARRYPGAAPGCTSGSAVIR
jgi:hypothetical protein